MDSIGEHHPGPVLVVTAMALSARARADLSDLLGADHVVIDIKQAPPSADIVLAPVMSGDALAHLRSMFPRARVLFAEIEDSVRGIRFVGPLSRILASGPDGYLVARGLEALAPLVQDQAALQLAGSSRPGPLQITTGTEPPRSEPVPAATRTLVRDYEAADEPSWLRCRVLGFLDTSYYDDVWASRPAPTPGLALVAVVGAEVVAICDASPAEHGATIDTVVVHPDHRRSGLATALLDELVSRLRRAAVDRLDAWTRDDAGTHAWYDASGFAVAYRYLHVYASGAEEMADATRPRAGLLPRSGHFHADTQDDEDEADLRRRFTRVHACHRFVRDL